ncbi:MAG TPA: DHA2 family efflux MFS transporter permease subunit [Terriglobales bacterium]|nr:DHA2 family efflux MFS transporter permease subunit [Terriglobales bacterium]
MYIIAYAGTEQEDSMAASVALPVSHEAWRPSHNPWLIALTVTLATFMEVLDTSIANVALPHIAGSLGASSDESTWVLTSYLVSNAIVLPISAWLATRVGRKRFYMVCVAVFATSSFLCGLAPSLGMLIFFRVLQGAGGGGLQPSEQAILADTFPASKRGMAFAVYGMAVVVAPAIGPTLGGWITDNYSWRWIFYINVPISVLSLYLTHRLVEDPPYLKEEKIRVKGMRVDYMGLGLVAVGIGFLQIVLDKGQEADWFSSHWITLLSILAVGLLVTWVIWEWRHPNPIVELKLLQNRNFAAASFFMFILGIVLYGTTVLIPQFLQLLLGYSAMNSGEALAGGGFIMMLTMPIAGILVSKGDARIMMACGFAATALSLYYMTTHISLQMDFRTAAMLRIYQTAGLAFIFIPSNTLSYVGVPREKSNQISSMINFIRNIGGSIGIALIATFITRATQQRQSYMAGHLNHGNPAFRSMVEGLTATLHSQGLSVADATRQAYGRVAQLLEQQAAALAYKDVISVLAVLIACLIPMAFIMKRPAAGAAEAPPMH